MLSWLGSGVVSDLAWLPLEDAVSALFDGSNLGWDTIWETLVLLEVSLVV